MYRDYYKLSADPFRLTPDPAFVSAHQSYRKAQAQMQRALEQGDGILVVTGGPGTGKTTLIEHFLARLKPGEVLSATVVGTPLATENLLRKVGYAFGLDAKNLDQATLQCELQEFLTHRAHARALLIIDEAHNLSSEALEEVRMLLNMYAGPRPLLQIFLVGQEKLHEALHTPEMQQLHQRIMAACVLTPLSLQETHDYMLHRLNRAGWRGNPAIGIYTFILVHRFSEGLPRYISKLCARLLGHGARLHRQRLSLDDVVAVIDQMQNELLLPLPCESHPGADAPQPPVQDLIKSKALPTAQRIRSTYEEQQFLESRPSVVQDTPASVLRAAQQASNTLITITTESEEPADRGNSDAGPTVAGSNTRVQMWHWVQRTLGTITRVSKSAALVLGREIRHLIAGMRHLSTRSQGLDSAAQTLWTTLQDYSSRAWAMLSGVLSSCRERLSRFAGRVGTRKIAAGGASLLVIFSAIYLLSMDKADEQHKPVPTVATVSLPASQSGEQTPAPEADVNTEEPTLSATQVSPAIEPQAAASFVPQVGQRRPTVAASKAGLEQTPDLAQATTVPAEVAQQNIVTKTNTAEAAPGKSAATAREARIEDLLALADRAMARDRLRLPEQKSAWHYFSQVLELDPDNQTAIDGMHHIAARYRELAVTVLQKQEFDKAEGYIQRGLSVVASDSSLLALQKEVQRQRRELRAQQEQEELLALRNSEPASSAPVVDQQPKSGGLLGALKRVFSGSRATP